MRHIKQILLIILVLGIGWISYQLKAEVSTVSPILTFDTLLNFDTMKEIKLQNSSDVVLVDDEDYSFLSRFEWRVGNNGYCERAHDHTLIHRLIMGWEKAQKETDHINRNKLDNRKSNLRKATATQNSVNRAPKINGQYKGVTYLPEIRKRKDSKGRVYYSPVAKRYKAVLKHDGVNYCLGSYYTPEEAAMAYDKKAYELHGEYAYINLPEKLIKKH